MAKFPVDAPIARVIKAFQVLGFRVVREGNHIAMERQNTDGTRTPMTDIVCELCASLQHPGREGQSRPSA